MSYNDRKKAKAIARMHHPRKGTYQCPVNEFMFHVGAIPRLVIEGHMTRDEYFH